jgi:hypothetical protein
VNLHLTDYEAQQVRWSIGLICEWLRAADDQVRDQLADFGFGLRSQPRDHLERMLADLDAHVAALRGQSPATTGTGGGR